MRFSKDWETYILSIDTDKKGPISIRWNDVDNMAKLSTMQSGLFGIDREFSKQAFYELFPNFYKNLWKITEILGGFELPEDAVIIDIGSGIGVMDLLLSQYLPKSKFYLVDKNEMNLVSNVFYSTNYFFYNSWEPVLNCIETTNIDPKRFKLNNPEDDWPEQVDCISSYFSWCMHYPKETYWNRVKETLKPGGKLILDIRNLSDRNVIEEISDEIKSYPRTFEFKNTVAKWIDNAGTDILGHRCVWTRP